MSPWSKVARTHAPPGPDEPEPAGCREQGEHRGPRHDPSQPGRHGRPHLARDLQDVRADLKRSLNYDILVVDSLLSSKSCRGSKTPGKTSFSGSSGSAI